ncbi:hypothetical protein GCM10023176_49380 [Micromonospora coerulea]|uniref:Uncharacterized protein n=1 Tax=Micromonospora coerulea TaxID=47856 RepID=A0ABP8SZJ8_9ACTN
MGYTVPEIGTDNYPDARTCRAGALDNDGHDLVQVSGHAMDSPDSPDVDNYGHVDSGQAGQLDASGLEDPLDNRTRGDPGPAADCP